MPYCPNCGQKLEENYYFCPKCGIKTKAGTAEGVSEPWEDVKKAFLTAGEEMRKAFQKASEEMRKAFEEARKEAQPRKTAKGLKCTNCGATNPSEARFCQKCGKPLT